MTLTTKILLALLALTIISAALFIAYKTHEISQRQQAINEQVIEMKKLQDDIARSQSKFATQQDLDNFAQQNGVNINLIRKDLSDLNAAVMGINEVVVNSSEQKQNNLPSTSTTPNTNPSIIPTVSCNGTQIPCPNIDPYGFLHNTQNLDFHEQFKQTSIPIGSVSFNASQQNPWSLDIYPRKYNITNVLAVDESNRHTVYSKVIINSNGKDYPVEIEKADFLEQYPEPHFSWFNPKLHMFVSGSVGVSSLPIKGEFTPGVAVAVMSYGKTMQSPDISILQVGAGYGVVNRTFNVAVNPISFNVGKLVPGGLANNTYLGPTVQINTQGDVLAGAALGVGF